MNSTGAAPDLEPELPTTFEYPLGKKYILFGLNENTIGVTYRRLRKVGVDTFGA